MREDVSELIQFDTSAWGVVVLYVLLCLALTRIGCFSENAALLVGFGIDAIWAASSMYAAARVLLLALLLLL